MQLDVETLRNPEVQKFSTENFISLKYDANEEIGKKYFKEFNCQFVPHLLFLDSKGNEVDRIIGFLPSTEYLMRIKDITHGRNTLKDYLSKYENGAVNEDIVSRIAMKYNDRMEDSLAAVFYGILFSNFSPDPTSTHSIDGKYFLASYWFETGYENALYDYLDENPGTPYAFESFRVMSFHYADTQQLEKELSVYEKMLMRLPVDPGALNAYAWRMAEIEMNLEDALEKVKKAVFLTFNEPRRQANIIDTEAEIYWKLKRYDEAIKVIEKAILIEPKNEYFKDQKEKFIESKKAEEIKPV